VPGVALPPRRVRLNAGEILRLLQPCVSVRFKEHIRAVVPLALYLALFQILFLRQMVEDSRLITGGLFVVNVASEYVLPEGIPEKKP
jgi:hypothetical protein